MEFDHLAMEVAIAQAKQAAALGEVPVGAAIYRGETLLAQTYNRRELDKSALAHAELLAIDAACKVLGGWRLWECTLYVTLEPCPMCTGAIINARIPRVVFGAYDPKAGCLGSITDLSTLPFNHKPQVVGGVRQEECAALLQEFFARLRTGKKQSPCK